MDRSSLGKARVFTRWALAFAYIPFGVFHILSPDSFLPIVPPWVPSPQQVVILTGAAEIAGGLGILLRPMRRLTGWLLSLYAVCVWPANAYHAFAHIHVPRLPDSWWYHGPRLVFQLVMIWAPLFAARITDWPLGESKQARTRRRAAHGRSP